MWGLITPSGFESRDSHHSSHTGTIAQRFISASDCGSDDPSSTLGGPPILTTTEGTNMTENIDLTVEHLPVVGAGEFDTSYAPIDFTDGQYRIKSLVNYGSFDAKAQYREGGILWSIIDTETGAEVRLIAQESDARLILFAENKAAQEAAETEFSLANIAYSHVAKGTLFQQLHAKLANAYDIEKWRPLMTKAFETINMDATLKGLGYTEN